MKDTARREDETLIDYLMRLSAIVGECNVVETQLDGELVPYYNAEVDAIEQAQWNAQAASRFPILKVGRA